MVSNFRYFNLTFICTMSTIGILFNLLSAQIFKKIHFKGIIFKLLTMNSIFDAAFIFIVMLLSINFNLINSQNSIFVDISENLLLYLGRVINVSSCILSLTITIQRYCSIYKKRFHVKNLKVFCLLMCLFTILIDSPFLIYKTISTLSKHKIINSGNNSQNMLVDWAYSEKMLTVSENIFSILRISNIIIMLTFAILIITHLNSFKKANLNMLRTGLVLNERRHECVIQVSPGQIHTRVTRMILSISIIFIIDQLINIIVSVLYFRQNINGFDIEFYYFFSQAFMIAFHFFNTFCYYTYDRYYAYELKKLLRRFKI